MGIETFIETVVQCLRSYNWSAINVLQLYLSLLINNNFEEDQNLRVRYVLVLVHL